MYTIKRAAELTGISLPTLRAWERRYEIVSPQRTEAGYRLYDDEAVRALSLMNDLVRDGWTASLAAEEVRRRLDQESSLAASSPAADRALAFTPKGLKESRTGVGTAAPEAFTSLESLGSLGSLDSLDLVAPAARLDATAVAEVLDDAFSRASFEAVVDGWLMAALQQLGNAWADGRVTVAGEHLVAHAVHRRLAAAFEAAGGRSAGAGPTALIGLPAGARHELGLLAFAVAARRAGIAIVYVGADLPVNDWTAAVAQHDPDVVVLAAPTASDAHALRRLVADLWRLKPELRVAVGGDQQSRAPDGCLRLGHEIGPAARQLAQALGSSR